MRAAFVGPHLPRRSTSPQRCVARQLLGRLRISLRLASRSKRVVGLALRALHIRGKPRHRPFDVVDAGGQITVALAIRGPRSALDTESSIEMGDLALQRRHPLV